MSQRIVSDWLTGYLEVTSELEAKERLHLWTGMVCLSAALRRRVYLPMRHGLIYPNLYVYIVAESAAARKSTAMNYGKRLLMQAFPDLMVFQDDMTPQGLIKYMHSRDKKKPQGDFVLFADELANLFGTERNRASKMVILLTTAFNCDDVYDHLTVRDSLERIYNMYPVMIAATDPTNLKTLPQDAIGGLTGRIIWVIEGTKRHVSAGWLEADDRSTLLNRALRESLIYDLQQIAALEGPMTVEPKAQELYNAWYKVLSDTHVADKRTDAFYHRCHTTALQIAMLLSVSSRHDLVVTAPNMARAIQLLEQQLPEIKRITLWSGTGPFEQLRAKYVSYLQNTPGGKATRRNLLRHLGVVLDEFDRVTATLVEDGTIESPRIVNSEMIIALRVKALPQ